MEVDEGHYQGCMEENGANKKSKFTDEDMTCLREYFASLTCNLRVLGSQLGLEPSELDGIEDKAKSLSERKQVLLDECLRKERISSWEELAFTLEQPSLKLTKMAFEIKKKYVYLRQHSLDSTASHSSMNSPTSPPGQSLASSFSSAMSEGDQGGYGLPLK